MYRLNIEEYTFIYEYKNQRLKQAIHPICDSNIDNITLPVQTYLVNKFIWRIITGLGSHISYAMLELAKNLPNIVFYNY